MPTVEQFRRWADELEQAADRTAEQASAVGGAWGREPIRGGRLRDVVAELVVEVERDAAAAAEALRRAATACRRRALELP